MENFEGRVAVVTGGASGIGKAMARAFAAEGMHVVIADVEAAALDASAKELDVVAHQVDVSQFDEVAALAEAVMTQFGRVDIVANNAGVGGGGDAGDRARPGGGRRARGRARGAVLDLHPPGDDGDGGRPGR